MLFNFAGIRSTSTIVAIAVAAALLGFAHPPSLRIVASIPLEIAYLSLVAGVLAVLAWNSGVGILGPAAGVLFDNLVPITAFAIGIAQGHRFGGGEILGVALVIGALLANSLIGRPAPAPRLVSRPKFA